MVTLLKLSQAAVLALALAAGASAAQDRPGESPHRWLVQANASHAASDSDETAWLNSGLGKTRYDKSDPRLALDRLLIEYRGTIRPTLFTHLAIDYQNDGAADFDMTEGYLEWRPVPRSANRHRFRFGGFYPRLSLENIAPGWETPFSLSSSAINSWISEEVKLLGAEWSLQRNLGGPGSPHAAGLFASLFYGNDPSGTLLAWKGWGIHDRQTRWREQLPLPPLPQLADGTRLRDKQAPWAEPFKEIDHQPGYVLGAEWRYAQRAFLQIMHYDNRADPESTSSGQYGWATDFNHVAFQFSLPWKLGLMAQWMRGRTMMGGIVNGLRVVDNEFEASYVMLTRLQNRHRITVRYDDFSVTENDFLPLDNNRESGHALALAYMFEYSPNMHYGIEWLTIDSERPARAYLGVTTGIDDTVVQAQIRLRFNTRSE